MIYLSKSFARRIVWLDPQLAWGKDHVGSTVEEDDDHDPEGKETLRGNYYNALSDTTLPVYGSVDKKTI